MLHDRELILQRREALIVQYKLFLLFLACFNSGLKFRNIFNHHCLVVQFLYENSRQFPFDGY